MGRESSDPVVVQSSVALLQERFRQLQRVKEMREERELHTMVMGPNQLKLFNPSFQFLSIGDADPYYNYQASGSSRLFIHFLPTRTSPPHQVSLSQSQTQQMQSCSTEKKQQLRKDHHHHHVLQPTSTTPSPSVTTQTAASPTIFETRYYQYRDDVDTSLHL